MSERVPVHVGNARARRVTLVACVAFAATMVGAAYAAVPLYDLFCRVTGFDGTPIARSTAAGETLARTVLVRFDTNVAPGLRWSFVPDVKAVRTRIGETQTVFFRVRNEGSRAVPWVATYNVQPGQAGAHFVKMKCFCFDEQTLAPGEEIDFPVVFYVDPSLARERSLDELSTITLSYTYFASRNGQPVAAAPPADGRSQPGRKGG